MKENPMLYSCCKCNAQFKDLQHLTKHIVKKCVAKIQSPIVKPKIVIKKEKLLSSTEEGKNEVSSPNCAESQSSVAMSKVIEEGNVAKQNIRIYSENIVKYDKSNNGQHVKIEKNDLAKVENMTGNINDKSVSDNPVCDNNTVPRGNVSNPKVCSFCKKSFPFAFQLKNHKSTECDVFLACKKKFKHTFSQKNICSSCNLKFTNASALKTHKFTFCKLYRRNKRKKFIKAMKNAVLTDKKRSRLLEGENAETTIGNVNSQVSRTPNSVACSKELRNEAVSANRGTNLTLKISNMENQNKPEQPNDPPQHVVTPALSKKSKKSELSNFSRRFVCDICYYDFENITALAKHKAFYCRRFNDARNQKSDLLLQPTNKSKSLGVARFDIKKSKVENGVQSKENNEKISLLGNNTKNNNVNQKNNKDSLNTSKVAQKNVGNAGDIDNTSKVNCVQCGTFFDNEHNFANHVCKLDCTDSKQSESVKSPPNIQHPESIPPTKKRKPKKLKFICPYCHEGQATKSDLSTHKMLYCKEANKKKLALIKLTEQQDKNSKNEGGNSVQISGLPNPQISEQENGENRKVDIQSKPGIAKRKTPKSLITAPEKDPEEDKNICNICGTQFEYSFALQRHKALYCKIFKVSAPTDISQKPEKSTGNDNNGSENCNATLSNQKGLQALKSSDTVPPVETKEYIDNQEAKRIREQEKGQKRASGTQPKAAEQGSAVKCDKCELVFKYEVDLLWHKYKYCGKPVVAPVVTSQTDIPKSKKKKLSTKREMRTRKYINILVDNDIRGSNVQKVKSVESECMPDKNAEKPLEVLDVNSEDKAKQKAAFDLRNKISNSSICQSKHKSCTKGTHMASKKSSDKYDSQPKELFKSRNGIERDISPQPRGPSLRSSSRISRSGSKSDTVTLKISRNVCEIQGISKKIIKESSHLSHISSTRMYREISGFRTETQKHPIYCETCGERMYNVKEVTKPRCGHKNALFKCPICKSYFSCINLLILHQGKKHEADEVLAKEKEKAGRNIERKYFCFLCGAHFRYIHNLVDHNISHHKFFYRKSQKHCEKPIIRPANPELRGYACVFCNDKLFDSMELLLRHEDSSKSHKKNVDIFKTLKPNYSPVEHRRFKHICYICKLGFVSFKDQQIHTLQCASHYALESKAFKIAEEQRKNEKVRPADAFFDRKDSSKRADSHKNRDKSIPVISDNGSRPKANEGSTAKNVRSIDLYKRIKNMLNSDLKPSVSTSSQSVSLTSTNSSPVRDPHSPTSTSNQEFPFINCSSPENFSSPSSVSEFPNTLMPEQKSLKLPSLSGDPSDLDTSFVRYYDTQKKAALKCGDNKQKADSSGDISKVIDIDDEVKVIETYECFVCGEAFESSPLLEKHLCAGPF